MAFKKITRNVENIQTLPDKPYLDAQVLKSEFDKGNKIIKEDFNELSGELDQYSSYVNSAYSPKARKNIVVGDELQNETLYFDFASLTYSDMHSDAYLIYVDDNHYIKTTLKSASEAGIVLKDGNTFKTLFTITNEDVISVNQTYYTFSSSCGNVVEINSSYIEYTKCYINDEDKTLTNLANIQSIGDNLTLSNSGRLDATGGGGSVDIDDSSITKNTDDEIQTSGVIDAKTSATNKFWTGTLAEYNAITTKDNNTFYNITDDDVSSGVPAGGTTGQVLKKNSSTDYDTSWGTITVPTKMSDLINDLPTVDMVIYFDDDTSTTYNIYGKTDDNITIDDQEVTKVTFDGITLFEKETPPSPYTLLDYIQSTGTQYINTQWNPGGNGNKFRHEATMSDYTNVSTGQTLFGNWQSGSRIGGFWRNGSGYIVVSVGSGEYLTNVASSLTSKETWKLTIDDANKTILWNKNGTDYTGTYSGSVYNSSYYLNIFAGMNGGETSSFKLHEFKTYEISGGTETLVRHFVPAKRNADDVVGLLDKVNDVFYENAGTGTFNFG